MLQAHGDADQPLNYAGGLALRFAELAVRGAGRVRAQGFGVAQVGAQREHLQAVEHVESPRTRLLGAARAQLE